MGYHVPVRSVLLSTGPIEAKAALLKSAKTLSELGIKLYATRGTSDFLRGGGVESQTLHWPLEGLDPDIKEYLVQGKIDLVINIPKNFQEEELTNDYIIRRLAVDFGVPLITNSQLAQRFVEAISRRQMNDLEIKSWGDYGRVT